MKHSLFCCLVPKKKHTQTCGVFVLWPGIFTIPCSHASVGEMAVSIHRRRVVSGTVAGGLGGRSIQSKQSTRSMQLMHLSAPVAPPQLLLASGRICVCVCVFWVQRISMFSFFFVAFIWLETLIRMVDRINRHRVPACVPQHGPDQANIILLDIGVFGWGEVHGCCSCFIRRPGLPRLQGNVDGRRRGQPLFLGCPGRRSRPECERSFACPRFTDEEDSTGCIFVDRVWITACVWVGSHPIRTQQCLVTSSDFCTDAAV